MSEEINEDHGHIPTTEQQQSLRDLAKAIAKPTINFSKLKYTFIEGSVIFTSEGHLVGMIHGEVYNAIMMMKLEEEGGN